MAHRLFDPEDSRTSSPTDIFVKIEDEDGDVEGYQTADNFQLGSYKLKQFSFVEVTKVGDNFMDHYQGKLGLGYGNYFLKNEEFNFLEKLKKDNLIKKQIFSISTINEKGPSADCTVYCADARRRQQRRGADQLCQQVL